MRTPAISDGFGNIITTRRRAIPNWLRNPAGFIVIAAAVFGLLGTATLILEIGRPFGRFITYGFIAQDMVDLAYETPEWWAPIAAAPISGSSISRGALQYGDKILTINGLPYSSNAWAEMARAYENQAAVRLEIRRIGVPRPVIVDLPVAPFSIGEFVDIKLPELLVGLVFWLLAVIVLRARPDAPTNRVFAAVAACVAVHRLTAVTSLATDDRLLVNLPKVGHMLAAGLIGPLLVHLALLFPSPLQRLPRRLLVALYALGLMSGLVLAASRLGVWGVLPEARGNLYAYVAFQSMLLLLLAGVIALFGRLIWSLAHRRTVSRRERRVVRIVLFGLLLSLPPVLITLSPLIPSVGQVRDTFLSGLDLRYLMLAIPIAFAVAIIRYQTFQSPSGLFIFLIALSLSALLAAVGVAFWLMTLPPYQASVSRPPFLLFFIFILLGSVFWSRQADWRGWFGRLLHRADRNYESARAFGRRVMDGGDMHALPAVMAQALVDELNLERAGVWLWQPAAGLYEQAAAEGRRGPPPPGCLTPSGKPLVSGRALHVAWPETPEWLSRPAGAGLIEVFVPMVAEGRPIGIIGLGRRWDEEIFDERDMAIAELVGQQAALFTLAAAQVEELRRVPERVAEAQERERYRLSGELHDTIQQFLGRLPFYLTVGREMIGRDQAGAVAILDRCIADVGDAAGVLREIRANLAPNQLETSLARPLGSLATYVEQQTGLAVHLSFPEEIDHSTTIGTRHALYRVIQQALDNTAAHAEATEVTVMLARQNGHVLFSIADNGVGATAEALERARQRGSFGLQSMRARVETVGGEFVFDSAAGRGTTVSGWVPAA